METCVRPASPLLSFATAKNLKVHVVILALNIFPISCTPPPNKSCERTMLFTCVTEIFFYISIR